MNRLPVTKARRNLSDVVNLVAFGGDHVVLSRNGRDLVAIVPIDAYRRLEEKEDRRDAADVERALRESNRRHDTPVPYEEARKRLGLGAGTRVRRRRPR